MTKDLVGFKEPITKLIECVSIGIGKVYEPTHIRRLAKAKADEIEIIGSAIKKNQNILTKYEDGNIKIDKTTENEFLVRTQQRILHQELMKQNNIESIIKKAYKELENCEEVSDEPVSKDWVIRFFNSIEDISDESLQTLWAKILSGEIKKPKTYSYRTLNLLKMLSHEEVVFINNMFSYIVRKGTLFMLLTDYIKKDKPETGVLDIEKLKTLGLIGPTELNMEIENNNDVIVVHNEKIVLVYKKNQNTKKIKIHFNQLTDIGTEIYKLSNISSTETIQKFAKDLFYKLNYTDLSLHDITFIKGSCVEYNTYKKEI